MTQVRLGRITLHWCRRCDLPLLRREPCGICGSTPLPVALTPPGDARPAFDFDLDMVREVAAGQFGADAGRRLLPGGEAVMLNRVPDIDRTDEIVAGGRVLGNLAFLPGRGLVLQLRMAGAERVGVPEKGWVVADRGAVASVLQSSNLMGPGVLRASEDIRPGDEVIVLEEGGALLATGSARMSFGQMRAGEKGIAVKIRWRRGEEGAREDDRSRDGSGTEGGRGDERGPSVWSRAVLANRAILEGEVRKAVSFIKEGVERVGKPVAVSYSGGKDSLATLLLVLEAGIRPRLLFVDTGLELPETVENARSVAASLGLELLTESAGDAFWRGLPLFGPPARDARWCCKCCKLGPVTRLILKEFPGGVLSFIGQRRYESEARALKGPVWKNPWVPGQIGASPIQDWPALQLWLFLFSRLGAPAIDGGGGVGDSGGEASMPEGSGVTAPKLEAEGGTGNTSALPDNQKAGLSQAKPSLRWNPWYERGLERIGCFLCPASNLADLELVKRFYAGYGRWEETLKNLPEEWKLYGLWRWRRIPRGIEEYMTKMGVHPTPIPAPPKGAELAVKSRSRGEDGRWELRASHSPLRDVVLLRNRLLPLGKVMEEEGSLSIGGWARIQPDGAITVWAASEEELERRLERLREALLRAEGCAGCGVCTGRCRSGAAGVREGRMVIDPERCTGCGSCLEGPCPVTAYGPGLQSDL
ncbi:MAG: phosphoadenosine phosphosulfate reductase family protein [Thermoplasmata archaeon]